MARKTSARTKPSEGKKATSKGGRKPANDSADGRGWATPEQKQFLWDKLNTYMSYVPEKKYQPFWAMLEKEWKDRWPEIGTDELAKAFNGKQEHELTAEQLETLAQAEETRLLQLKTWYRWRAPPMHERDLQKQHTKLDEAIEALTCRQRALRPYEMYSHMFRERFEDMLQAQYQENPQANPGECLKIWQDVAQQCYANEESDVKAAVVEELEESAYRQKKGKEAKNTPQSYLQAIKDLNAVLGRYLDVLATNTGWSFLVVLGGPHPKNPGGAIEVMSHSVGTSYNGKFFPDLMTGFEETVMQPWINHLKLVYPPSVCAERALSSRTSASEPSELDGLIELGSTISDTQISAIVGSIEASSDVDGADHTTVGGNEHSGDGGRGYESNGPTSNGDGGLLATSAGGTSTQTNPTFVPTLRGKSIAATSFTGLLASSHVDGNEPALINQPTPAPIVTSFTELLAAPLHPDATPAAGGALNSNSGDFSFVFGSELLNMSTYNNSGSELGEFDFSLFPNMMFDDINNGNLVPGSDSVDLGSLSLPGPYATTLSKGMTTSNGFANHLLPTPASNVEATSSMSSAMYAVSATKPSEGTTTTTEFANYVLPTTVGNVPVTSGMSSAISAVSDVTQEPVLSPAVPGVSDAMQELGSTIHSPEPPAPLDTSIIGTSSTVPIVPVTNQVVTSRGRQVKPSQMAEQMNRIGSTAGSIAPGKENAPPSRTNIEPDWLKPAKEYLEGQDLGADWANCVLVWLALEGKSKKNGTLPLPKERPEEWTKWVMKTSHGRRGGYDQTPAVESALEFGTAIMKWWHSIQPEFRRMADSLHPSHTVTPPPESAANVWTPLKKSGPNGLIIILVLLSWWAHAAKEENKWEDDSMPAWRKTVIDVRRVMEALDSSDGGVKRKAGDALPARKKKQQRTE